MTTSEGTPYQLGYRYGLSVARGLVSEPVVPTETGHEPASFHDWWAGYRHARNSEAVRLRHPLPAKEVTR